MKHSGFASKAAVSTGIALLLCSTFAIPIYASDRARTDGTSQEQFFLISSVDIKKHELVLKMPTEVTELVRVADKTVFLDENGKAMQFQDLRAGDTVYATISVVGGGVRMVTRLRKGPMTVDELHRRYLQFR